VHPNEPGGQQRVIENNFNTGMPWPIGPSGDFGSWALWDPNGNATFNNGVMQLRYPTGMQAGDRPASIQAWNGTDRQQFSRIYEHGRARVVGSSFETPVPGFKMLGYWGVNDPTAGGGNPTQLYQMANSGSGMQTSWAWAMYGQGNVSWGKYQNRNTSKQIRAGEWFTYEILMVLNSVGQDNGILKVWQDGVLVMEYYDVRYRTQSFQAGFWGKKLDAVWGGGSVGPKVRDDFTQFDYIYVSGAPMQ
jgi:hypothetical protein